MNKIHTNNNRDLRETINNIKDLCYLTTINVLDIYTNPLLML